MDTEEHASKPHINMLIPKIKSGTGNLSRRQFECRLLTWKSHWTPQREHFSFQANMATFLLWTIQRARLRVVRCGSKRVRRDPMLTWKNHRSPLREHFSFQANMATFLLWALQDSPRAHASTLRQLTDMRADPWPLGNPIRHR